MTLLDTVGVGCVLHATLCSVVYGAAVVAVAGGAKGAVQGDVVRHRLRSAATGAEG